MPFSEILKVIIIIAAVMEKIWVELNKDEEVGVGDKKPT